VTALQYGISDTLVLAKRSLLRIPRQPDLLVGFTVQPILFVLLFVYVFGGAIQTPGFDYVDFLMPGIIVQSIAFGGFVTALGLADDLKKGLMDRFRSLPMTRSALLTGRTLGDVGTNIFQLVVMFTVGLLVGFNFSTSVEEVAAGIRGVFHGQSLLSPMMATKLLTEFATMIKKGDERQQVPAPRLTDRELEVLKLVAKGLNNRDIAKELFISENTVKNHIRNILEKLHLHSRMEAVVYAVREKMIEIN